MMKRMLAILLAMVMLLSLVGCGAQSDDSAEENESISAKSTLTDEALEALKGEKNIVALTEAISNVNDIELYLRTMGFSKFQPYSTVEQLLAHGGSGQPLAYCELLTAALADNYPEVGIIHVFKEGVNHDYYSYVKIEDTYHALNPFSTERIRMGLQSTDLDELATMCVKAAQVNGPMDQYEIIPVEPMPERAWDVLSIDGGTIPIQKGLDKDAVLEKIVELTAEEYTEEDIQAFVEANLSLKQATETFAKPQDAINYLRARGFYVDYAQGTGIIHGEICWVWNPSAEFAFSHNAAHCAGTANIMNHLLAGDNESQGYVNYVGNPNCHIFNYFYNEGLYFFCDFTGNRNPITRPDYNAENKYCYILYVTSDLADFSAYFMKDHNNSSSREYITHLECYEADGEDIMPTGYYADPDLRQYTEKGERLMDVLPLKLEEKMQILFIRDGYTVHFAETPPDELRPSEDNIPTDAEFNMEYGATNE